MITFAAWIFTKITLLFGRYLDAVLADPSARAIYSQLAGDIIKMFEEYQPTDLQSAKEVDRKLYICLEKIKQLEGTKSSDSPVESKASGDSASVASS